MIQDQVTVKELVERRDWPALRSRLASWPGSDIVELLEQLTPAERFIVFRLLPRPLASDVFSRLSSSEQDTILQGLTEEETRRLLADLTPDDRTHLFEEMPARVTRRLLQLLPPSDLDEARSLLGYPEESVGRLMTPNYVAVRANWTVERALQHIRVFGKSSETINRLYVLDESGRLIDDLELSRLVLAEPTERIERLIDGSFVSVSAFADREETVSLIRKYDLTVLPVVDSSGALLGIVTIDDVLDVEQQEITEDFHRVGSVSPIRVPLRDASVSVLYRGRVVWLLALVFMNIFSGAGIALFQDTIAAHVNLVFFLPLLTASAGNAGSQAATLMVRALATGDVHSRDWLMLLRKEVLVAGAMGLTMGAAVSGIGMLRGGPPISLVVALTMFLVVILGSLVGMALPFVLSQLKLDPAAASTPLVTSVADVSGVLIYLSIASRYL
ncbi:MAG: magnesium transporter [Bryobacteraceae bacterium]|jgi:Mg2+ transporter (mgtE)|nr:magnesium transporter [Bryobacteraceae bacterium]